MRLSRTNRLLLAVILLLCAALAVCAVRLHAAARHRAEVQARMNSAICTLAEKMGRMYEAAAWEDAAWFESSVREFADSLVRVQTAAAFVEETDRQREAYRAARVLLWEMPFVREESYNRMTQLPRDLQGGRFRTLYELLRDSCTETYDGTMTNLAKDLRTTELLRSRGIVLEEP